MVHHQQHHYEWHIPSTHTLYLYNNTWKKIIIMKKLHIQAFWNSLSKTIYWSDDLATNMLYVFVFHTHTIRMKLYIVYINWKCICLTSVLWTITENQINCFCEWNLYICYSYQLLCLCHKLIIIHNNFFSSDKDYNRW